MQAKLLPELTGRVIQLLFTEGEMERFEEKMMDFTIFFKVPMKEEWGEWLFVSSLGVFVIKLVEGEGDESSLDAMDEMLFPEHPYS